jgi:large subunit ribosomal protein L4
MADKNFEAPAFTAEGTSRNRVALPATLFDGTVHMPAMHQAVKAFLANQRQGNAATKTRRFVTGGNQKPWKQKGTGRARQGSIRAPNWPGGGTVFGPHGDRNYSEDLPRKVKALARKSAFNARARENSIFVIDAFGYTEPRTKAITSLAARLGLDGKKLLILTDGVKPNVHLSGRNLPNVLVMPYSDASTYHILWSDAVLIEGTAIGHTLAPIAEEAPPPRKAKAPAPAPQKQSSKPAKATATPAAKKSAAKKSAPKKGAAKKGAAKKSAPKASAAKGSATKAAKAGKKAPAAKASAAKKKTAKKKGD